MRRPLGWALVTLAGCASTDVVAISVEQDRAAYCQGQGPAVLLDGTCTGALAEALFAQALCGCAPQGLPAALATDGFDSRAGPWAPGGGGAGVGWRGDLQLPGPVQVSGGLTVSGGLSAGPRLEVEGELAVGGALGGPDSSVAVDGGARVGGAIAVRSLQVTGTLTTPAASVATGAVAAGERLIAPVQVPAPCRCAEAPALDVGAVVAAHLAVNHDAALGLSPDALADLHADTTLELPCGRFALTRLQASDGAAVTLRATGRAALFVGAVTVAGPLTVELAPGAELDLFVAGNLNLGAGARLGDPARPAALRVYAGAPGAISLAGGSLAGNLHAPSADLTPPAEVYGAAVVSHFLPTGPTRVHRDRAVEALGAACR